MQFLKKLFRNLIILAVLLAALYILFPEIIGGAYRAIGLVFGPVLVILLLIVASLPNNRIRR